MSGEMISIVRNHSANEPFAAPVGEKGKPWVTLADMCRKYRPKNDLLGRLADQGFDEPVIGAKMAESRATRLMFALESLVGRFEELRDQVNLRQGDARDARIAELEAENAEIRAKSSRRFSELRDDINRLFHDS